MALSLHDKWIWDFWLKEHAGLFHLYYLQAPRAIEDPELRHWNVSIGHAVSYDLVDWTIRADALAPSTAPGWDDLSTWTGSIIEHDGTWSLFYTGTSRAEDGKVQRIGRAVSDDLDHWERADGPLIEADPRWYEKLGPQWHDEAWRDPWVFRGDDGVFHALITARTRSGERFDRGCIAHARSDDMATWEVRPPITTAGGFGELEVPQVHEIDDDWYLLFCSDIATQHESRRGHGPGTGTYYAVADTPLGPFDAAASRPLQADRSGSTYAGRLVEHDGPVFLSWLKIGEDGGFVGELADPIRVAGNRGTLELEAAAR